MIDLTRLPAAEAERLAYAEGFTGTADLFARIAALEAERDSLQAQVEQLQDDLYIAKHERAYPGDSD
jgi:hypothetical protein